MGRKEDGLGTRPSLSAFRNPFITPITDSNAWIENELALADCIANADTSRLLAVAGLLKNPLVQLMEATL
jgi:hypothetical protein